MEATSSSRTNSDQQNKSKIRNYSVFDLSSNFLRFILSPALAAATNTVVEEIHENNFSCGERWTCNTCESNFQSLHHQRSHFKSDFHRFNIKLKIAGKDTVKEDDFDERASSSLVRDYDISSISGSEDENHVEFVSRGLLESKKQKCFLHLPNGDLISFWKCLLLGNSEKILLMKDDDTSFVRVREVIERLVNVISEPRNNTHLRVMLLVSGGHFAGCVFDGNSVVAHKSFHRYVTRAKAGKKQSSEDATGKVAHSAGASIRRHNQLALKKDIQELIASWKLYIDASACIFIHAPSHNQQLLFDGQIPHFSYQNNVIRHIPLTVRRPTFKETQRLYKILTQISIEPNEEIAPVIKENLTSTLGKDNLQNNLDKKDVSQDRFVENMEIVHISLPLHEAAKAGDAEKVLELLEKGLDPCGVDERGRTAYRVAAGKEVRNTFRRFMALNPDKWDWVSARVPGPLTKEMEESQISKQAKKEAKRKARAKEVKLLRKAREKKAQETHRSSGRVAGVLVLVIGSLLVIAFRQMGRGRT